MSDFLLTNQVARKLITGLHLPVPVPMPLRRVRGPWQALPLADRAVAFGSAPGGDLAETVAWTLARAGAMAWLSDEALLPAFAESAEAYGRPVHLLAPQPADAPAPSALMFDATGCRRTEDLRAVHAFFHPLVRRMSRCGRVVVLARPEGPSAEATAVQRGLEGFVRSLSKEIGKRGSTAQFVTVEPGAEDRIEAVLRFCLSPRSAFVTGQPVPVGTAVAAPATAPRWTRPLEGKIALVTGAARGIGAATARRLAEEGAHVICLDRPADDALASRIAREIRGSVLLVDLAAAEAPHQVVDAITSRHGRVDVVVHNAGITRDKTLGKMRAESWDITLDVNLRAVVRITDALIDGPLADDARLVLLSSVTGLAGNVGQTNYSTSKAGVAAYARALAPRVAGRGITVNAIAPGFIETRLTEAMPAVIREFARRLSSLGQGGLPIDVAEVATFLSSPGAVGITGHTLRVCGGALIGA